MCQRRKRKLNQKIKRLKKNINSKVEVAKTQELKQARKNKAAKKNKGWLWLLACLAFLTFGYIGFYVGSNFNSIQHSTSSESSSNNSHNHVKKVQQVKLLLGNKISKVNQFRSKILIQNYLPLRKSNLQ